MNSQSNIQEKIVKLHENGGNDATLLLLEEILQLREELQLIKDTIAKDSPEDVKVEKIALRLASKLATLEKGDRGDPGENGVTPSTEELVSIITPLIPPPIQGKSGKDGRDGRDGRDGIDGRDGKDGQDGKDGKDSVLPSLSELSASTIEFLRNLEGEQKLRMSDIYLLEDTIATLQNRTQQLLQIATMGQRQSSSSSGGGHTIEDEGTPLTQRTSLNFVGAGVFVTDAGGKTVVTISGGSGLTLTEEIPTGTVDDTNTSFIVSNEPLFINVNGAIYPVGQGAYASYLAGTITLNYPVSTNGFIRSYYNS